MIKKFKVGDRVTTGIRVGTITSIRKQNVTKIVTVQMDNRINPEYWHISQLEKIKVKSNVQKT